jgi:AcrR family transcriptional regulator
MYRHFANKEDLIAKVALEGFIEFDGALERARDKRSSTQSILRMTIVYLRFAQTHPAHYRVMFSGQLQENRT